MSFLTYPIICNTETVRTFLSLYSHFVSGSFVQCRKYDRHENEYLFTRSVSLIPWIVDWKNHEFISSILKRNGTSYPYLLKTVTTRIKKIYIWFMFPDLKNNLWRALFDALVNILTLQVGAVAYWFADLYMLACASKAKDMTMFLWTDEEPQDVP